MGVLNNVALGMAAGVVGTVAMTAAERLEMAVSGRQPSDVPGKVGASLLPGKNPDDPADVAQLVSPVHWGHGVLMGGVRGLLGSAGLSGATATAAHFGVVWGGDAALYRALGLADVPWEWSAEELRADLLGKGVYAVVTGAVYDAIS